MAASPEPWLARHLGVLAPGASPALREEYTRRAGTAAAYREAAGITNPEQAVSPEPHRSQPRARSHAQGRHSRPGDPRRSRHHPRPGPRRARSTSPRTANAPSASAPPDVSSQLRLTAQAEADALPAIRRRPSPARPHRRGERHGPRRAAGRRTPAPRSRQRPVRAMVRRHPRHQGHSRESHSRTATARARPARRRTAAGSRKIEPQTDGRMVAASSRRMPRPLNAPIAREHQAVSDAGEPWPSQRTPTWTRRPFPGRIQQTSPEIEPVAQTTGQRGWTNC